MARILIALAIAAGLATPAIAADPSAGHQTFKAKCSICHGDSANSPPGVGPRLFGVVGRRAGSLPGYSYSPAMKAAGFVWSTDQLKLYLTKPQALVHGNKMPFQGLPSATDRENVAAYLATLH